ncbi:hypothetical protein GHT06_013470 [Daphnia sinensis]|uniref:Uncharacterized protein n=1 Tax=Daphnia sinensis TaxID=1820382 RepID=A0AAD5KUR8_9CRUS|nr:hypothetical protein GHT06_013470 [Daphnia sinensis]
MVIHPMEDTMATSHPSVMIPGHHSSHVAPVSGRYGGQIAPTIVEHTVVTYHRWVEDMSVVTLSPLVVDMVDMVHQSAEDTEVIFLLRSDGTAAVKRSASARLPKSGGFSNNHAAPVSGGCSGHAVLMNGGFGNHSAPSRKGLSGHAAQMNTGYGGMLCQTAQEMEATLHRQAIKVTVATDHK